MRLNKKFPVVSVLVIACMNMPASYAANLADVYKLAKASDPKYQSSRYELESTDYVKDQALAGLLPTLAFEKTHTISNQEIISNANKVYSTGSTRFATKNESLTLSQPIFKAVAWLSFRQAGTKIKQAAATFAVAEHDLILRTSTAYISILAARDALFFAQAERDAIKSNFRLAEGQYENGLAAIVILHDAKARYALKEASVVTAENALDDAFQALREITGKMITEIAPLRNEIPLALPAPNDMSKWLVMAEENNPLLESRRYATEVALQEVDKQRSGHLPVLDLVATSNRRDAGGSLFGGGSVVQTNDIMLRFTLPIYSGGLTTALTAENYSRYQISLANLERDGRQVERQVRSAYQGEVGGIGLVKAFSESVVSNESARSLKFEGFKSGIGTMLGVLNAERDLYAAKRDLAKARYDFLLNGLRLKQAAGSLSEADLVAMNDMLQ